jgi:pimeloyl-ACP methyl ester carboxylesterase
VLIAANRSSETIPAEFRAPVDRWTKAPDWLVRPMLRFRFAGQFARQNGLSPQWTKRLKEMGSDADPAFLKWAARATARWAFSDTDGDEITGRGVPIYQLHGSRDDTIPLVERHADRIIEGPHLLTWTNPDEVNAFIAESFGLREAGSPTA